MRPARKVCDELGSHIVVACRPASAPGEFTIETYLDCWAIDAIKADRIEHALEIASFVERAETLKGLAYAIRERFVFPLERPGASHD